jgi:hypothetical protein
VVPRWKLVLGVLIFYLLAYAWFAAEVLRYYP